MRNLGCPTWALPAEMEQADTVPSCFSSHTVNKCPFQCRIFSPFYAFCWHFHCLKRLASIALKSWLIWSHFFLPSNLLILCLIESNAHLLIGLAHNSLVQISVLFSHASHLLDQVNSCFVKTLKLFKLLWKYDIQKAMSAWSVVPSGPLPLTSLL